MTFCQSKSGELLDISAQAVEKSCLKLYRHDALLRWMLLDLIFKPSVYFLNALQTGVIKSCVLCLGVIH